MDAAGYHKMFIMKINIIHLNIIHLNIQRNMVYMFISGTAPT